MVMFIFLEVAVLICCAAIFLLGHRKKSDMLQNGLFSIKRVLALFGLAWGCVGLYYDMFGAFAVVLYLLSFGYALSTFVNFLFVMGDATISSFKTLKTTPKGKKRIVVGAIIMMSVVCIASLLGGIASTDFFFEACREVIAWFK